MPNSKNTIIITGAIAGASLIIVAVVLNSLVATGMVIRDIETSEHADEIVRASQLPADSAGQQMLNINGYWKKPVVTVSYISRGISQPELDQIIKALNETMHVPPDRSATNSTSAFVGWPDLLATLSGSSNVPSIQVIEQGTESADIRVYLEEEKHVNNKPGLARIAREKVTYEIVYAEIHIYSVRDLQIEGILGSVFKHELGHALGIGHGTSETSVMHSPIIIVNNTAIGQIGSCEEEGAAYLYSGGSIGEITCGQ